MQAQEKSRAWCQEEEVASLCLSEEEEKQKYYFSFADLDLSSRVQ